MTDLGRVPTKKVKNSDFSETPPNVGKYPIFYLGYPDQAVALYGIWCLLCGVRCPQFQPLYARHNPKGLTRYVVATYAVWALHTRGTDTPYRGGTDTPYRRDEHSIHGDITPHREDGHYIEWQGQTIYKEGDGQYIEWGSRTVYRARGMDIIQVGGRRIDTIHKG